MNAPIATPTDEDLARVDAWARSEYKRQHRARLRRFVKRLKEVCPLRRPLKVVHAPDRTDPYVQFCYRQKVGPRGGRSREEYHKLVMPTVSHDALMLVLIHEWAHMMQNETDWAPPEAAIDAGGLELELACHDDEYWKIHGRMYRDLIRVFGPAQEPEVP